MCIISWAGQEGGQRGAFQKQVLGWWTVPGPVAGCSESWGTSLRDMDVKLAENRAALGGLCIQAHGGRGLPDTGEKDPSRGLGQDRHPTEDGTCGRESRVRRCQPLDRTGCVCVCWGREEMRPRQWQGCLAQQPSGAVRGLSASINESFAGPGVCMPTPP